MLGFPLVIKQVADWGGGDHELSDALPGVGLPFDGAVGHVVFAHAIAPVLSLAIGF